MTEEGTQGDCLGKQTDRFNSLDNQEDSLDN